ncbi:cytochrome P450 2F3-like [Diretmus argenteus]
MFGSLVLLWVVIFLLLFLFRSHRGKNFPPGPRPLPVFGNLLQLNLENPLGDLERLAKRYGNVYSFFMGPRPMVFLNGLQAIKEALVVKAADFNGRPQDLMVNHAVQRKAHAPGIVLSDYGPGWKEHRRFGLMTLRNFGLGKQSMEERILREIQRIMKPLEESIGKTINPQVLFHNAAYNIICQVLFDTQHDYDDEFMKLFVTIFKETSKIINGPWGMIYDSIPMVRHLPLPFQKAFKLFKIGQEKCMGLVAEHKKTRVPGKPRHLIDCYLDELDKRGVNGSSFSEDQLASLILDLQFAGTDTTSNGLLTAFLYLMTHPHIQERCQQEIDQVLDGKDQASFEDRHDMPYMQAVIHEIQRIADTVPLSVFHCTTKDTELMGYSIPRGTIVIPNLSSVLCEEGQWKFPHEFNPENFLNDQGEFVKPDAFLPFSAGPRMCLGEALARMELFLIMVTLLRKFQFIWPEDAGQPDYTTMFGTTQSPKPYRMVVRLRPCTGLKESFSETTKKNIGSVSVWTWPELLFLLGKGCVHRDVSITIDYTVAMPDSDCEESRCDPG